MPFFCASWFSLYLWRKFCEHRHSSFCSFSTYANARDRTICDRIDKGAVKLVGESTVRDSCDSSRKLRATPVAGTLVRVQGPLMCCKEQVQATWFVIQIWQNHFPFVIWRWLLFERRFSGLLQRLNRFGDARSQRNVCIERTDDHRYVHRLLQLHCGVYCQP